jgi:hypothetical protein
MLMNKQIYNTFELWFWFSLHIYIAARSHRAPKCK